MRRKKISYDNNKTQNGREKIITWLILRYIRSYFASKFTREKGWDTSAGEKISITYLIKYIKPENVKSV